MIETQINVNLRLEYVTGRLTIHAMINSINVIFYF